MDTTEIDKKIKELDTQAQDIYIQLEKLKEQKAIHAAADVIKSLPLFDYEYDNRSLLLMEKKSGSRSDYHAIDAAANGGHHCTINLEEDVILHINDSDMRIQCMKTDYREVGKTMFEDEMRILAKFAKKHKLNVKYRIIERKIKQKADTLKDSQEDMLTFKQYMSTKV